MDKMKIRVGVIGISPGAGETFVARALDYYLNIKDAPRVLVSRPEKFEIVEGPGYLGDLDVIVGVIDPLPSRLKEGVPRFAVLKATEGVLWLVNKDNTGVDHRELKKFLELDDYFSQEALNYETVCRAEYSCEKVERRYSLKGIEDLALEIKKTMSNCPS